MIVARTRSELEDGLTATIGRGTIALVPTMGYLHRGHLSLVDLAADRGEVVAVSTFVNPLQFAPDEDFDAYPRDEERDLALLEDRGVDLVFAPDRSAMYPHGEPSVTVDPGPAGDCLCGRYRPGHFRGVLTVVAKLFELTRADVAVFGRKDFQQLVLVRRMCRDLDLPVRVVAAPIVREPDGLALSSRNAYLSDEERAQAVGLSEALRAARHAFEAGETSAERVLERFREVLRGYPLLELQYAEAIDEETLEPETTLTGSSVLAAAAFCGSTRLIDNVVLA